MSRFHSATASAVIAAALVAAALVARGGNGIERTAIAELGLIALAAAVLCAALAFGARGRLHGVPAVAAFAVLAALTVLSKGWSIAPDLSQVEAGRTLAYLATFAGAVGLARLMPGPGGASAVARGIVLAAVAVCAYGLAARVWPGSFDELAFTGRIGQPFDYWNALAGMAALGIVPALWLGARRGGSAAGRALAYPATGLLIVTLLLAQSRGALGAAILGCLLWLALVPLRLRSLTVLGIAGVAAAPVTLWALGRDPFSVGLQPLAAREAVAGDFGLLLAATVAILLAAGLAVQMVGARHQPSLRTRFRAGLVAAAIAVLVPLALTASVATSERGLTGTIADRIDELTSDSAVPPVGGGRLASVASERGGYWREAFAAFGEDRLTGLGAGSFALARLAHRSDGGTAHRAHGFVPQTLADLGLLGGLAALALLAAWLVAAARATALSPRRFWRPHERAGPPWTSDRAATVALALAAIVYGIHGLADWTWFVPGLTATALVAAGFVAGQGPAGALAPRPNPPSRPGLPALAACAAVVAIALLCAWTAWQPVPADRSVTRAYALLGDGEPVAALHEAADAREHNRDSVEPLYAMAAAYGALGRDETALRALRIAARQRPRDPGPWEQVATLELDRRDAPGAALAATDEALRRDPRSSKLMTLRHRAAEALALDQAGGG